MAGIRWSVLVLLLVAAVAAPTAGAPSSARQNSETQGPEKYTARLGWVPITGADRAAVTGKGAVTATLSGRALTIAGTFEGLAAPASVARLHAGIAKGARGPAIGDLTVTKAAAGTIAGTLTLAPAQVDAVRQGRLYVQLHSDKGVAPDGSNLWGWLLR
jgi:hypothetical protein